MPNIENIKLWVADLESGDSEQTKGVLRNENGLCCLGVASETAVKAGVVTSPDKDSDGAYHYGEFSEYAHLPVEVEEWLGLEESDPFIHVIIDGVEQDRSLTELNDDEEWTFAQIAEAIKANFLNGE